MKGILLAGGTGTRLHPMTFAISKQLLPVYDKPMVYYSLSTLMLCGIREILLISTPEDVPLYKRLLGDGSQLGCQISYKEQPHAGGLPEAFLLGADFIGDSSVALILGDNIFYAAGLSHQLQSCTNPQGGIVFAYHADDPRPYGVLEFDNKGQVIGIEEKPQNPRSRYIIPGLYFYTPDVVKVARSLRPSARGELEITDIHNHYLQANRLHVKRLSRGTAWMDMGTADSLLSASYFVQAVQQRQGFKIACPEEIAFRLGYINKTQLQVLADKQKKSGYGNYLIDLLNENI